VGISINVYSSDLKAVNLGSGYNGMYYVGSLQQCINEFLEGGEIWTDIGLGIVENPSVSVSTEYQRLLEKSVTFIKSREPSFKMDESHGIFIIIQFSGYV
jgi:hypothetical protein